MFDGFQLDRVDVGDVTLRVRYGGEGESVVLLHGITRPNRRRTSPDRRAEKEPGRCRSWR